MSDIYKTEHAKYRAAGRAISDKAIEAVFEFGRVYRAGSGARVWFLGKRAVKSAVRKSKRRLDEFKNLAVIVSASGAIITVMHCHRPFRHWQPV